MEEKLKRKKMKKKRTNELIMSKMREIKEKKNKGKKKINNDE